MMEPMEHDFVNDEPLGAEQNASSRKRRRRPPSVLEPPRRRREQIGGRTSRERTELFLRENPGPMILGVLAAGLAIGLAIRYASRSDEKEVEIKTPSDRINWSVLTLPFLWPLVRGMKERLEDSAGAVREGVDRVKDIGRYRYTKPIRRRWKSWTH